MFLYECCTSEPAVKVRVGGHLEAWMWEQEAANIGEARVDVLADILQLLVLVRFHLKVLRNRFVHTIFGTARKFFLSVTFYPFWSQASSFHDLPVFVLA